MVKDRQVRKWNHLLNKKEGNITWQSTLATRASPQTAGNSQAGRQVVPPILQDNSASQEASAVLP